MVSASRRPAMVISPGGPLGNPCFIEFEMSSLIIRLMGIAESYGNIQVFYFDVQPDMLTIHLIGLEKARSQKCDDFRQVDSGDVLGTAHPLVDMCHRHDAVLELSHCIQ